MSRITVRVKPELVETFVGFHDNKRRRPGDVFDLVDKEGIIKGKKGVLKAEDQFSDVWMERVESPKKRKAETPKI